MGKRALAIGLLLLILGAVGSAAGGGPEDPLISRTYLEGAFTAGLLEQLEEPFQDSGQAVYREVLDDARTALAAREAVEKTNFTAQTERYMKEKDVLVGPTGLVCTPLSGSLAVAFPSGAVVDVTDGAEVPSGALLSPFHTYIVAEDTLARFTALSPTAVVRYEGYYAFSPAASTVDYPAIARALKTLHLFQGSGTAYGEGFDLDQYPTRLQALVLFIRVLGEEEAALACTAPNPFRDIPWGERYAAYAYEMGYTNGYGDGTFGSNDRVDAVTYTEFLLRAMGHSTAGVDDWTTALERATDLNILTEAERERLRTEPFYRAQVAYLSYYALEGDTADGTTLADRLMDAGVFSPSQWRQARSLVTSPRMS